MASVLPDDNTTPSHDPLLTSIAMYVYHYEISSPSALAIARLALLDALGCVMETLASGKCTSLIGPLVKGCTVHQGFHLPGTPHELDPVKGAFDLGVLIRYLDHNDGFIGAEWGHPSGMFPAKISRHTVRDMLFLLLDQTILELSSQWQTSLAVTPQRLPLRLHHLR